MKPISVVIPYRYVGPERHRVLEWLLARYAVLLPDAQVILADDPVDGEFNRARARNAGVAQADHEVIFVADADTMFFLGPLRVAVNRIQRERTWIFPFTVYYNATEGWSQWALRRSPAWQPEQSDIDYDHRLKTTVAGNIVLTQEALAVTGGWDERFACWGYEDNAFQICTDTLFAPHIRTHDYTVHLYHPPGPRFESPGIEFNRKLLARYQAAAPDSEAMKEVRFG